MAASLVDSLSSDFDPDEYRDEYREALLAVIDAKLGNGEGVMAPAATTTGDSGDGLVLDLMAALRASVERSKGGDAAEAAAEEPEAAPKPASRAKRAASTDEKKPAARKSTAKTAASKTTAAKKRASA